MKCVICNEQVKGNIGLARHCSFKHKLGLLVYKIKYEDFEIPKCICGENCKHKDGLKFGTTCGDEVCIKETQRVKRLKFMKENPDKTAWRLSTISYPEKLFKKGIIKNRLDKDFLIIRERPVFPFFIDFAFENEKVAVEIDGSQHLNGEVKEKDNRKDEVLSQQNWRIFRITAKQVLSDIDGVIKELLVFIGNNKNKGECGVVEHISPKSKDKCKCGNSKLVESAQCLKCHNKTMVRYHKTQRKVQRPTNQQLLNEIKELGYVGTGKKYGVSDNTIRKWKKFYEKHN